MMRRLLWVGVGVAVTVLVVRKGRAIAEAYLPAGTTDVVDGTVRVTRVARSVREAFSQGMAEREKELRHELIGDVDVDELRSRRDARRHEPRERARSAAVPSTWAQHPVDDPDDDDGYTFF